MAKVGEEKDVKCRPSGAGQVGHHHDLLTVELLKAASLVYTTCLGEFIWSQGLKFQLYPAEAQVCICSHGLMWRTLQLLCTVLCCPCHWLSLPWLLRVVLLHACDCCQRPVCCRC